MEGTNAQCCLDKGVAYASHGAWHTRKHVVYYSEDRGGQTCHKGHHAPIRFLETKHEHRAPQGAFSHSANYYVAYPRNTPENHPPPTEACTIHSKQHRRCRFQDPGTRGYRWWKTAAFPHSAGSARCTPSAPRHHTAHGAHSGTDGKMPRQNPRRGKKKIDGTNAEPLPGRKRCGAVNRRPPASVWHSQTVRQVSGGGAATQNVQAAQRGAVRRRHTSFMSSQRGPLAPPPLGFQVRPGQGP